MLSHGLRETSSPEAISQKHAGLKRLEQPGSWMLPYGSPFLSYTAAPAGLSISPKSRVRPSTSLLRYNTICWQGGKTPSCRWMLSRLRSPFSSQRLCPEALLGASTVHDKGLSGTTENPCQKKLDLAQKGAPMSVTQPPAQPGIFSL